MRNIHFKTVFSMYLTLGHTVEKTNNFTIITDPHIFLPFVLYTVTFECPRLSTQEGEGGQNLVKIGPRS